MPQTENASPSSPANTMDHPADPILLVGEELARFHNFAMACWAPEAHRDEDNQDVQTALAQLRSWEEDDPSERLNPPHITAAVRLTICLRDNVGLVLDTVPDVASLWKPEFDAIEKALRELTHKYKSGAEDYKTSLESTCSLAYQTKRMLKRLEAKVPPDDRLEAELPPDDEEWPRPGWIRADNVTTADGKKVPRSTVQAWADEDDPSSDTGPGGAKAYPNDWIERKLRKYKPKRV